MSNITEQQLKKAYSFLSEGRADTAEAFFTNIIKQDFSCASAYWGLLLCEFECLNEKELEALGLPIEKSENYKSAYLYASEEERKKYKKTINKIASSALDKTFLCCRDSNFSIAELWLERCAPNKALFPAKYELAKITVATKNFTELSFTSVSFAASKRIIESSDDEEVKNKWQDGNERLYAKALLRIASYGDIKTYNLATEILAPHDYLTHFNMAKYLAKSPSENNYSAFQKYIAQALNLAPSDITKAYVQELKTKFEGDFYEQKYIRALAFLQSDVPNYESAKKLFQELGNYKDSAERCEFCNKKIKDELESEATKQSTYLPHSAGTPQEYSQSAKKVKKPKTRKTIYVDTDLIKKIASTVVVLAVVTGIIYFIVNFFTVIKPANDYTAAFENYSAGNYEKAARQFGKLGSYKDSELYTKKSTYAFAENLFENKEFEKAAAQFESLGEYNDSKEKAIESRKAHLLSLGQYKELVFQYNVTEITVPQGTTVIAGYAMSGLTEITTVNLPNSIQKIDWGAFQGCSALVTINYDGTMAKWYSVSKNWYWDYGTGSYTVYCTDGQIQKSN